GWPGEDYVAGIADSLDAAQQHIRSTNPEVTKWDELVTYDESKSWALRGWRGNGDDVNYSITRHEVIAAVPDGSPTAENIARSLRTLTLATAAFMVRKGY